MKLEHIHPEATVQTGGEKRVALPFKAGKVRKVGAWRFEDIEDIECEIRQVFHYDTLMGQFENTPQWGWTFEPISTGWGSASDQQGMNKIMRGEWTYRRNGGDARYIAYDGVTVFRDSFDF